MEGIWGVADVDADEEEDADGGADESEDKDMDSLSKTLHASEFEVKEGVPWIIWVSGTGDDIINGMYQLLATTRHVTKIAAAGRAGVRLRRRVARLPEQQQLPEQCVHLLQGWVQPHGAVVYRAGAPPLSSLPRRRRRRIGIAWMIQTTMATLTMYTMTSNSYDNNWIAEEGAVSVRTLR